MNDVVQADLITAKPVGRLYWRDKVYYLLRSTPYENADWQPPGTLRFLVTPTFDLQSDKVKGFKPPARFVSVYGDHLIEHAMDMPEITLVRNSMIDISADWKVETLDDWYPDLPSEQEERLEDFQLPLPV